MSPLEKKRNMAGCWHSKAREQKKFWRSALPENRFPRWENTHFGWPLRADALWLSHERDTPGKTASRYSVSTLFFPISGTCCSQRVVQTAFAPVALGHEISSVLKHGCHSTGTN